ncbi:hypothetical protein C0J52_15206 [Blattella germanica]|nr:hypothetical protein C0J52_15206 [Blattella germanica]
MTVLLSGLSSPLWLMVLYTTLLVLFSPLVLLLVVLLPGQLPLLLLRRISSIPMESI